MKNKTKNNLLFLFIVCIAVPQFSISQSLPSSEKTSGEIQWLTFQEAIKKNEKEPKKIFIDVYTAWCGWCKRMDATTFKDPMVVAYINKNYHAVKFDAETKDTIRFNDHDFFFHPEYRSNELAYSLMSGKMSYPTSLYLDEVFTLLSPVPGYLTAEQIQPILTYFGDNIYKTKKWDEYVSDLNGGGASGK
ncbi:MAG: DUF255 domain-containing protein [Bacteroidia bacterium]|nr:DUF255 domain-containing protein [Bacteroidia bacterium]